MANFKTGTEQSIQLALTFSQGDVIGNYTQITAVMYYVKPQGFGLPDQCVKFAYFALDPNAVALPDVTPLTWVALTVNADTLTCVLPSALTDTLDLVCGEMVNVHCEIGLGLLASAEAQRKASTLIGVMEESVTEGWL
jgi:hypothetical protein